MDIGSRIKKYRECAKMSQEELADKVFVSRQTISNWETNKNYPDIKSISYLSNIFNVSLDNLIEGDIEDMKKAIIKADVKGFEKLSIIYSIELIIMIISVYPLMKLGVIGILIWIIIMITTLITAVLLEKQKKKHDIQTYKEIVKFMEEKSLSRDEKNQELGKRPYQKVLLVLISAIISVLVIIIMNAIFK